MDRSEAVKQASRPGISVSEANVPFSKLFLWKGMMLTLLRAADSCLGDDQPLVETVLQKRVAVAGG